MEIVLLFILFQGEVKQIMLPPTKEICEQVIEQTKEQLPPGVERYCQTVKINRYPT